MNEKIQSTKTYFIPEISFLKTNFIPQKKQESFWKQFIILSRRMFRIKLNDRLNTWLLLLQAPLIALLSCIIFEKTNLSSLFVMILSTIWFGTNNVARDIVGELNIYMRERMFNLQIDSYLIAKIFTAWVFSFLQLIPFVWIIHIFLELQSPVKIFFFLCLLALCAILMGLILSATFENTEKVMTLVPVSLIPQILLSGVIERIRNEFVEFISYFTITRWGMNAIAWIQEKVYTKTISEYQWIETKEQINFQHFYEFSINLFALSIMILAYFMVLYYLMKRKDKF
ncbi:MAG: ABC transporter permease [Leptospiraceae bacterium]|nr:ABC transporter permease [Leptospiraceae bacterium]